MKPSVQKIINKLPKEKVDLATQKVDLAVIDEAKEVSKILFNNSQDIEREAKGLRSNISRVVNDYYELEERFKIAQRLERQLMQSFRELGLDYRTQQIGKELTKAITSYKSLSAATKIGPLLKI